MHVRKHVRRTIVIITSLLCATIAQAQKKPVHLAVMDFTPASTSAELAPLGAGLQSMITTDLGQVAAFVLVERARLKDIEAELKLHESSLVDKETASKIGGLAGASHLLVGSFTVVGGKMRLDARLFAVASGEVVLGEKMEGPEATFFELEKALVKRIVDSVGVKLAKKERSEMQKPQTQDYPAFQKFSEGIVLFDQKKHQEAIAAMQAAVARDPGFALAAQKLAEFQRLAPMMTPPEVKAPAQNTCRTNPLTTPTCQPGPGEAPPTEVRGPTLFTGDGRHPYKILIHSGAEQAPCVTPCEVHLPKGPVEIEVLSPKHYRKVLEAPGGPASVEVSTRNNTHLIVGSVLAGLTLAMVATTVGLHEAPYDPTSTSTPAQEYWPAPLSLAAGLAFPAIYYLLKIGKNDAKIVAW